MVDGSSLENWRTRKGIGGSNPSSSAIPSQLRSLLSKEFGNQPECPDFSRFVDTFTSIEKLVARAYV